MKIYKNKKGDIFLDIITLFIMMIVYFNIYPALDAITLEMLNLNPDSITGWFVRGFSFILLLGIVKYALVLSGTRGGITE